jgi:hypothetical protein
VYVVSGCVVDSGVDIADGCVLYAVGGRGYVYSRSFEDTCGDMGHCCSAWRYLYRYPFCRKVLVKDA